MRVWDISDHVVHLEVELVTVVAYHRQVGFRRNPYFCVADIADDTDTPFVEVLTKKTRNCHGRKQNVFQHYTL